MKTKNLTPFPFGTKITSRRPPKPEMTLVLRAAYAIAPGKPLALPEGPPMLSQGAMTTDGYAEDDEERTGQCIYPGDFADLKPRAEVMLRGTCHAPGARPVTECTVRFGVGAWSKTLRVSGRRVWSDDLPKAELSPTAPFAKMPLDWAHAYGGRGHPTNPIGMGVEGRELANVEYPGDPARNRFDAPRPASFGPINPAWPERAAKLGKEYGVEWKKERAPYYARDFDWSYFQAAPADQRLDAFLRGDEKLVFENFHPDAPRFEAVLPAIRVRAFVKDVKARFREVAMNLDTLFVDLEAGKLFLTWRGLDPIETDDKSDVATVLVGSEALASPPQPEAHWKKELEAFEADPRGLAERLPPELLRKRDEMEARKKAREEGRPVTHYDTPPPDAQTAALRKQLDAMPIALPNAKELEAKVADAVARIAAMSTKDVDTKTELAKVANDMDQRASKPPAPPALPLRVGGPPPAKVSRAVADAFAKADERKKLRAQENLPKEVIAALDEQDQALEEMKQEPFFKAILERPAYVEPGAGKMLAGQDYAERDLSGRDLRGADLTDANLAGANLARANLSSAKLLGAILSGADLTGAVLDGADLTLANLTGVQAEGASFRETTLTRAFLRSANLRGAHFERASGEFTFFPDADLSGAHGAGIALFRGFARGANLGGADFSSAKLTRCLFLAVVAHAVDLSRAELTGTSFAQGDLTDAKFVEAHGERSVWLETNLSGADFSRATLPFARMMQASAVGARFRRAILKESMCYRAVFDQADFTESQLFGIDFTKCHFTGTKFPGACLYDAKFRQTVRANCDFSGANLKQATVEDA